MTTWDTDELLKENMLLHRENDTLRHTNTLLTKACKRAQGLVNWYRDMIIEGQITVTDYAYRHRSGDSNDWDVMMCLDEAVKLAEKTVPDLWGTVDLWGIGKDWIECSVCHKMRKPYNTSLFSDTQQCPIICKSCSFARDGNGPTT